MIDVLRKIVSLLPVQSLVAISLKDSGGGNLRVRRGEHRHSQHEARGDNCLLLNFQIDNDFASCFASSNKKIIQISTNYHKLVFVLQRCTTTTHQQ